MKKELILVRHAKSSWQNPDLRDFDRPLNHRGKKALPVMASFLKNEDVHPDCFVASPAKRTLLTAQSFADVFAVDRSKICKEPSLYLADIRTWLEMVNAFDNSLSTPLIVGHNPGITEFVGFLTGDYPGNMPTCAIARIRFPFDDWVMVSQKTGTLVSFDYPKKFGDY